VLYRAAKWARAAAIGHWFAYSVDAIISARRDHSLILCGVRNMDYPVIKALISATFPDNCNLDGSFLVNRLLIRLDCQFNIALFDFRKKDIV
jgi:hypothetical protein